MKSVKPFYKGIIYSIVIFGGCCLVQELLWKYVDEGHASHSPGVSHLFILLVFLALGGVFITGVLRIITKSSSDFSKGFTLMNGIWLFAALVIFWTLIKEEAG